MLNSQHDRYGRVRSSEFLVLHVGEKIRYSSAYPTWRRDRKSRSRVFLILIYIFDRQFSGTCYIYIYIYGFIQIYRSEMPTETVICMSHEHKYTYKSYTNHEDVIIKRTSIYDSGMDSL